MTTRKTSKTRDYKSLSNKPNPTLQRFNLSTVFVWLNGLFKQRQHRVHPLRQLTEHKQKPLQVYQNSRKPQFKLSPYLTFFIPSRSLLVQLLFFIAFIGIVFRFVQLQALDPILRPQAFASNAELIYPQRGQIFIQDLSFGKSRSITSSTYLSHATFDPATLKSIIDSKKLTVESAALLVSSGLNLSQSEVLDTFKNEINQPQPKSYAILHKFLDRDQTLKLKSLIQRQDNHESDFYNVYLGSWLGIEEVEQRSYPESQLLSPTIGYMVDNPAPISDVEKVNGCQQTVSDNKSRGTEANQYKVSYYGLEQKFCSVLTGLNGRKLSNSEINDGKSDIKAQDGANVYLTIDYNIQRKAEEILAKMIKDNTNEKGAPKNGSIIVVETNNPDPSKNGRILAMAGTPNYDPNNYSLAFQSNPESFKNPSTNIDYEIGSVMKPMTVAMALNEYYIATEENASRAVKKSCDNPNPDLDDKRLCVSPNWTFNDYPKGKEYNETNGSVVKISNFNQNYFGNNQNLSNVLRDSINTGIADIMDRMTREEVVEYFNRRFLFGQPTAVNLPADTNGNIIPFNDKNGVKISNAYFGFGQGFTASPLQVIRAYMPIVNGGLMIEPYLYDRIEYNGGEHIDYGQDPTSPIYKGAKTQIIKPEAANLVKSYMVNTSEQGYKGSGIGAPINQIVVPGYSNGSKTGTSQIARFEDVKDANGTPVKDENGNTKKEWCGYDCNSAKGLTEHSFVGFGPEQKPRAIVFIKMSEPLPGNQKATSLGTMKKPYQDMLQYTLEYLGVPKDR